MVQVKRWLVERQTCWKPRPLLAQEAEPSCAVEQVKLPRGAWGGMGPLDRGEVLGSRCCPEVWPWGVQLVDRSKGLNIPRTFSSCHVHEYLASSLAVWTEQRAILRAGEGKTAFWT